MALASPKIHEGWHYDLRFDTTKASAEEIASATIAVIERLRSPDPPST